MECTYRMSLIGGMASPAEAFWPVTLDRSFYCFEPVFCVVGMRFNRNEILTSRVVKRIILGAASHF